MGRNNLHSQTMEQGQGRGRRSNRRALDPRRTAPPHLLLPHRTQSRHRRAPRVAQCAPVPKAPRLKTLGLRVHRPSGVAARCRSSPTSSPSGKRSACTSTITSNSSVTTTPSLTPSSGASSTHDTPTTPSSSSTAGSASPATCAPINPGAIPPCPSTCPRNTAASPSNGRPSASHVGPRRSGPPPPRSSLTSSQARRHPEQSYRSCLGILRLAKTYSDARLEAAAQRALTIGAHSVRSVESILKHRLDEQPLHEAPEPPLPHRPRQPARSVLLPLSTTETFTMLTHPTLDKLHQLKCLGMAAALTEQAQSTACDALSFEERLGLLVDRELTMRDDRRMTNRLRRGEAAPSQRLYRGHRLPPPPRTRQIPHPLTRLRALAARTPQRPHHRTVRGGQVLARLCARTSSLSRWLLRVVLATPKAAARHRHRPRGRHLSQAAGIVRQTRPHRGSTTSASPSSPPTIVVTCSRSSKTRYATRSTLVTSQLPLEKWHDLLGDPTFADAILDRLVHNAYKFKLKGGSMRKKKALLTQANH